jgi:uncharacterized membrane protein YdjX (TVP38/TMEM64 family)
VGASPDEEVILVRATVPVVVENTKARRDTRRTVILRIAFLAALILVLTALAYKLGWFDVRRATATIERLQNGRNMYYVGGVFMLIYAATTAVGFPALPFTVAGGAIFGHFAGSVMSWIAASVGMMLGYWLARGVGRETARRWLARRKVGEALTESTSFLTLLRLRLVPVIPLSVVNFAAGLAKMCFAPYVVASAIGVLPATVVYAYFADSLVRGLSGARTHAYWDIAIASGLLMLLSLVPVVLKRLRRKELTTAGR